MKGYKATYNGKCINLNYEVGKTYTLDGELMMCEQGFHFCEKIDDVLKYYENKDDLKIFEIEAIGKVINEYDKSVTDKLKVIREIPRTEWNDLFKNHVFDSNGNEIYYETSNGYWEKNQYDSNGNKIYYKTSHGNSYKIIIK